MKRFRSCDTATLRRLALGVAILAGLVGCGGPDGGVMRSVPPPSGWEDRILAHRSARDDSFRHDPETPLLNEDLATFDGLDYWEPDPRYRFVGPLNLHANPERFEIATTSGKLRPCERYGWVAFELDGSRHRLQVYRLLDSPDGSPDDVFLPFTDRTSGVDTYPAGRYVNLDGEAGGLYVLDFNLAYNPLCAYGSPERYVCPVTPRENRIEERIESGERGYKK